MEGLKSVGSWVRRVGEEKGSMKVESIGGQFFGDILMTFIRIR